MILHMILHTRSSIWYHFLSQILLQQSTHQRLEIAPSMNTENLIGKKRQEHQSLYLPSF